MIISDLNYLENTSEGIFGGRGTNIAKLYTAHKRVRDVVNERFTKSVPTNLAGIQGNTPELVVSADVTGNRTITAYPPPPLDPAIAVTA